jgi:exonuclease SbcC
MKAQEIFNLINYDSIKLTWSSTRYSLRITPGERRFAMLSGGEQTKLALAMSLAMLKELSNLKFCIFDEPTYGIDTNSRNKLADAIITAQKAAQMDQILLVSHDDVFDSQVEHSILLKGATKHGTEVVAYT